MTTSRRHADAPTPDVLAWRCSCLLAAGFGTALAMAVAGDPRYDLHALINLVERGCPTDVAVRIVAPIDEREPRC